MRIVIVEENQIFLARLSLILNGEGDFEVVGEFNSAEDALAKIKELLPDVMIVDINLPDISGIELIRKLKEEHPIIDVIAYSAQEDRETILSAIKAGASGYLLQDSTAMELIEAFKYLQKGGAPLSPRVSKAVIRELQENCSKDVFLLSNREKEIMIAVDKDMTYREIAALHSISQHTVHTHIKNIYEKLKAKNRKDAIIKARRKGLL